MLPTIMLLLLPNPTASPQYITNYQACSLRFFGNDFQSLARAEPEMLAVASVNVNQESFLAKRLNIMEILVSI